MSIKNNIFELGKQARNASIQMKLCSNDQKNKALSNLIKNILKNKNRILEANNIDLENGKKKSLSNPLILFWSYIRLSYEITEKLFFNNFLHTI